MAPETELDARITKRPGKENAPAGSFYRKKPYKERWEGRGLTPEQETMFEQFYRENLHTLIVHAYCFTADWQQAKDVVQDAFAKTMEPKKTKEFFASKNQIGWMKNMVKNTARNAVRSRNRQLKWLISYEEYASLSTTDDYSSDHDLMERCKSLLTEDELYLLKCLALDKRSYIDVADELGISMWACYKRAKKIKDKLRKGLEDEK